MSYNRFKIILVLVETNINIFIKQMLTLNREPLAQLLEQEKNEEQRLITAVHRYNENIRKDDILAAMQDILAQEAQKFRQFDQTRIETAQTILERYVIS